MKQYPKSFLIVLNILVLLPLLFLCLYVYPSADDFSYGVALNEDTFIDIQKNAYLTWTSRYISTAILTLSPIAFSTIKYFGFYSFFLIVLSIYALYYFFKSLEIKNKLLLSVSFLSVYSILLTSLSENYYWLAGSATYFLPSIFFLFFLGSLLRLQTNKSIKNKLVLLISIFIIGGCSEIFLGYSFIIIFLYNVYIYLSLKRIDGFYLGTLLFIFLIVCFILACPGNQIRSSAIEKISLIEIIKLSLKKLIIINFRYNIFGFIFILTILKITKTKINLFKKVSVWQIGACFIFFLFIGIVVSIYGVNDNFPPRVENLLVFTSFIFLFLIALKIVDSINLNEKLIYSISVLFLIAYFFLPKNQYQLQNNVTLMYSDIFSNKVFEYKKDFLKRDKALKSCNEICYVDEMQNIPMSVFFKDLSKDHNYFINKGVAKYYNLKEVHLK